MAIPLPSGTVIDKIPSPTLPLWNYVTYGQPQMIREARNASYNQ